MITTKEEICQTAISLFKKHSFEHISIAKICEELHVTRGSFYHHFESKNELLLFWFSEHTQKITFDYLHPSPKLALKQFILSYAALVIETGKDFMFHIFMAELELKGTHFSFYYNKREQFHKLIEQAKQIGEIKSTLPNEQLIDLFSASFLGTVILWRFQQYELDLIDNIAQLFESIFH